MDQLTQDLRQLENQMARYVFRHFIKPKHPELIFTEFRRSISQSLRNPAPSQREIIIETLYDLKLADEIANNSEDEFDESKDDSSNKSNQKNKTKKLEEFEELSEYGLPDDERCNFICLKKNKMYRCQKKQTDTSDCCHLHENEKNTLLESYLELEQKYSKIDS